MKFKVIIHKAKEGGYWAEVPTILARATYAEVFEEFLSNLHEACLLVYIKQIKICQ